MAPRRRSNPLALAILSVLQEGPRHPYDIAATLKARHKHESIRLNYGALYGVVDKLLQDGFVEVVETVRDGRRPERTIYGITEAGLGELVDWLADLVSIPQKEYGQFEAALSLLPSLHPEDALHLLEARLTAIDLQLAQFRAGRLVFRDELGLPRVFALESDYVEAQLGAERAYVAALITDIAEGTLEGMGMWRRFYEDDGGFTAGEDSYDPDWRALDQDPVPTRARDR
ncbi:PadR family transcriptional regulator [soil metagenome]